MAGCPRVEDERPGALRLLDAADRRAAVVAPLRVGARGEHESDRGAVARGNGAVQPSPRNALQRLEQVALQPRQDRLRLRIPETAVELEHLRAVVGQHEARVEHAGERSAAVRELRQHGPVNRIDELFNLSVAEPRDRRVGAHPAGVRAAVAVADALEVLRRRERNRLASVGEDE